MLAIELLIETIVVPVQAHKWIRHHKQPRINLNWRDLMDGRQDIARAHALVTNEVFSHTSMYIEQSIYT
jgi:hypothetical protein